MLATGTAAPRVAGDAPTTPSHDDDDDEQFLDEMWTLYQHDIDDDDWTNTSYRKICCISTVSEMCASIVDVIRPVSDKTMLFLMRGDAFPSWDDPMNIDGEVLSWKIPDSDTAVATFVDMCLRTVTDAWEGVEDTLQGVSSSPKYRACVIKVWVGDTSTSNANVAGIHEYVRRRSGIANLLPVRRNANRENIERDRDTGGTSESDNRR